MQANTGEPDIESQPNRASNLQEYVEGSFELNPKVYPLTRCFWHYIIDRDLANKRLSFEPL